MELHFPRKNTPRIKRWLDRTRLLPPLFCAIPSLRSSATPTPLPFSCAIPPFLLYHGIIAFLLSSVIPSFHLLPFSCAIICFFSSIPSFSLLLPSFLPSLSSTPPSFSHGIPSFPLFCDNPQTLLLSPLRFLPPRLSYYLLIFAPLCCYPLLPYFPHPSNPFIHLFLFCLGCPPHPLALFSSPSSLSNISFSYPFVSSKREMETTKRRQERGIKHDKEKTRLGEGEGKETEGDEEWRK